MRIHALRTPTIVFATLNTLRRTPCADRSPVWRWPGSDVDPLKPAISRP